MWHPRRFDGDPPPDMARALRYLRDQFGGPEGIAGLLAHSPAALNAVGAFEETFSLQTRLSPQLRSVLRLVVASELGTSDGIEELADRARHAGLEPTVVQTIAAGHDGDEPEAALVRLVRRMARDGAIGEQMLTDVESSGWSMGEAVEAITAAGLAVPLLWLVSAGRTDGGQTSDATG